MRLFKRRKRSSRPIDAVAEFEANQARIASRGAADLQDAARPMAPGAKAFMWLLLICGMLVMGLLLWRAFTSKKANDQNAATTLKAEIRNVLPTLKLPGIRPPDTVEPESAPPPPGSATKPDEDSPGGDMAAVVLGVDPISVVEQRRLASGLQDDQAKNDGESSKQPATSKEPDSGPMAEALQPLKLSASRAGRLRNRDFLITQGTMIDCVMDTKLVSAQAGMITCYATHDVRSSSGRVSLVDRGSKFVGYQQSVLAQGQPRIGVVWSRMESPEGVVINLDSPGTGPLGEAGLDGYIDTHFSERFGAAILVSLIGDVGTWAGNRGGSQNNNTLRLDGTSSAAQDAVATVLENTINIPPTLYRNQGGRVGIYVARDLDFSGVYRLRAIPSAGH
ncbi:type IV secretion system protein VirB10 [Achromobacter xylosoxidans]